MKSAVELFKVKQAYRARYKKSLEEDVAQRISGDLRKLLLSLVSTFRYERDDVDTTLATSDATLFHEKVSEKAFNDDEFIRILTTRSKAQLGATLNHYKRVHKIHQQDLKEGSPFSNHQSDEWGLTRVVTTRTEVDMELIKEEYQRRLYRSVAKATSGDYKDMLVALIGHGDA
ncbi:hypothetical protein Bca101_042721 [Brassica carinata]